jgi:transposase-like protein
LVRPASNLRKGLSYVPHVIVTDKLKRYGAAKREILPGAEHRQDLYLNNRAENFHQSTRQQKRRMQQFKSPGHTPNSSSPPMVPSGNNSAHVVIDSPRRSTVKK